MPQRPIGVAEGRGSRRSHKLAASQLAFRCRAVKRIEHAPDLLLSLSRVEIRELLAKMSNLGRVVIKNVKVVGMIGGVVLMVTLGLVESLQRHHLSHNGARKDFGLVQLGNVGLGNVFLFVTAIEDLRAILRAFVGTLTVQFGGIVGDGEKNAQQLAIRNLRGIEDDLDRLRMTSGTGADDLVLRSKRRATGVARSSADDASDMLEDGLNAPETTPSDDCGLLT